MKQNLKSKYFLIASILVYLISLFLPVHFIFDQFDEYFGFIYAYSGWITFPYPDFFCWLGNFTLLFSWIFYRKKWNLYLSTLTVVLMSFYGLNHITESNILGVHEYNLPLFGYWFWLLSAVLMVIYKVKKKSEIVEESILSN